MKCDCEAAAAEGACFELCSLHKAAPEILEAFRDACERLKYYGYSHEVELDFQPLLKSIASVEAKQ